MTGRRHHGRQAFQIRRPAACEQAVRPLQFKRPPADAAAQRFFEIFEKIAFFEKLDKIGSLTGFGPIWVPDSNSTGKTGPIFDLKPLFHNFLKSDFSINPVFGYFFTFEGYFEAWEHQNRTRHEKILLGSYSEIFWPDGKLIGARRRSKLSTS